MKQKKFGHKDFKRFHPSGSLGSKLKSVEDVMLVGKIPFISEKSNMKSALKFISKKLGVLVARNSKKITTGIITDGQIRRVSEKEVFKKLKVKDVMTKNQFQFVLMFYCQSFIFNELKKNYFYVFIKNKKNKTIGVIHIHNILENNIHK